MGGIVELGGSNLALSGLRLARIFRLQRFLRTREACLAEWGCARKGAQDRNPSKNKCFRNLSKIKGF